MKGGGMMATRIQIARIFLMSLSGMVEILRLHAKRKPVMPAPDQSRGQAPAGATLRLLVVCHTYRKEDEVIRLISARKADRLERAYYSRRWRR